MNLQKDIHEDQPCAETKQMIKLDFTLWEDESTGTEIPTYFECPFQGSCEFFDSDNFCPTINRVQERYTSRLGPT